MNKHFKTEAESDTEIQRINRYLPEGSRMEISEGD